MSTSGNDNREIRNKDLSLVEVLLQTCIQDIHGNLKKHFKYTNDTKKQLKALHMKMCHEMRTLRRWRNGTESWSRFDLDEFSRHLVGVRLEALRTRIVILQDTLEEIDNLMLKLGDSSNKIISQRNNIGCSVRSVQEGMDTIEQSNGKGTTRCEKEIATIEIETLDLQTLILEENGTKVKRKYKKPVSRCPAEIRISFEDNPAANRILRHTGHIRKLIEAFRDGGHVTIDDTSVCVENDLEVLRRQLRKVQNWQQGDIGFGERDVDDLELVLSAIERHMRPDVDLDACKRSTPSTSRSNSRSSDKSGEISYTSSSPITTEAHPPYVEACVAMKPACFTNSYVEEDDDEDDQGDIIDERLI